MQMDAHKATKRMSNPSRSALVSRAFTPEDAEACARSSLHDLGSIQSYGVVVAFDTQQRRIRHVSANLRDFCASAAADVLGLPIDHLLDLEPTGADWVKTLVAEQPVSIRGVVLRQAYRPLEFRAHRVVTTEAVLVVLEGLPAATEGSEAQDLGLFLNMTPALSELQSESGLLRFLDRVCSSLQTFTGYDRVMVYQFAPDWSGEVVAEACGNGTPPRFLGLRFPATDLPAQARELYKRNRLRVLADTQAAGAPLLAEPGLRALDQSHLLLRQMAPTHLLYLNNMGVRATLTISLMSRGELWGLVACHHHVPRQPPAHMRLAVRTACEWLSNTITLRLETLLEQERSRLRTQAATLLDQLIRELAASEEPSQLLASQHNQLCQLLGVQQISLWTHGQWLLPSPIPPTALLPLLDQQVPKRLVLLETLQSTWPESVRRSSEMAGLMAHALDSDQGWLVLWRGERIRTTHWAGRPDQGVEFETPEGARQLGPRQSFERWEQQVRGHCAPWTEAEQELCGVLARALARALQHQRLRTTEAELQHSNERLRLILKGANDAAWDWDLVRNELYYSPRYWEMLGYADGELQTTPDLWLALTHPDDVDYVQTYLQGVLTNGPDLYRGEFRLRHKQGHYIPVLCRGFITRDAQGAPIRITGANSDLTAVKQAEQALRESQHQLQQQFEFLDSVTSRVPGLVYQFKMDPTGHLSFPYANRKMLDLFAVHPDEAARDAHVVLNRIHPDDLAAVKQSIRQSALSLQPWQAAYRVNLPSGEMRWHEANSSARKEPDGTIIWDGMVFDVTDRVRLEQSLRDAQQAQRDTLEAIPDLLFEVSADGEMLEVRAPPGAQMLRPVAEQVGHNIRELLPQPALLVWQSALEETLLHGHSRGQQYSLVMGGETYWYELSISRKGGAEAPLPSVVAIARDISSRKQAEARINQLAFYDPLTGLCNRRLLMERMGRAQIGSDRNSRYCALIFIDLDHFKDLNDTQGHDVGDALLRQVASRLLAAIREGDTVARMGGDEFVVLLEALASDSDTAALQAGQIAEKILQSLSEPYCLPSDDRYRASASLGVALFQDHNEKPEDVLRRADVAMYGAKAQGRNRVRFYDPAMQEAVAERTRMERDLRLALETDGQLQDYYQPIVDAERRVVGYELLLRWQHPQMGLVSPAEFIPLAEQSGLILPLGQWVFSQAAQTLALWAQHPSTQDLTLSVNVSARQIQQADFVETVLQALGSAGAPSNRLKLELTETLLQQNVEDCIAKMTALTQHGIRFALDDFGIGYSSLAYLKRLPLDQLKIDRSFVRDLLVDVNDAAIARMVLQLAQTLDMAVVAEGIESEGQMVALYEMGCRLFQGYLFGKPAPRPDRFESKRSQ